MSPFRPTRENIEQIFCCKLLRKSFNFSLPSLFFLLLFSFASSPYPHSSSFVFFSPLAICLKKKASMKDTHVPLWIKCVPLLLGRSDVGVYTRSSL